MASPTPATKLRKTLQELFDNQRDDARLRDHLEGVLRDEAFPGLTWFWGPILYERSRARFRPLILDRFSDWAIDGNKWSRVKWADHRDVLERWLARAREARDTTLVRKLLRWQLAGARWGIDDKAWNAAVVKAHRAAPSPAARAIVLDEYADWVELTEDSAIALFEADVQSAKFIEQHLPRSYSDAVKRKPWPRLAALAKRKDEAFYFALYRNLTPLATWQTDILELARTTTDPAALDDELERRHPAGWGLALVDAMVALLEARGRDVFPYVRRHLRDAVGRWSGKPGAIVKLAAKRGWWDLWAGAIRVAGDNNLFNEAVAKLLADATVGEHDRLARLGALAGVSHEWNFPGFGLAIVHSLDDANATALYRRYPALARGAFLPNVVPRWHQDMPKLLAAAQAAKDDELVDRLASRYITRPRYEHGGRDARAVVDTADELGAYYEGIRDRDAVVFARRAGNVLSYIPAFSIHSYELLLRTNRLARLMFMRSFESFLEAPRAVQDLVEGSDIHVQMLAYRALAQDDERARALAVSCIDILLGTLLRPLHRKTRMAAFGALASAAHGDSDAARRILARARDALALPDRKYPKEELIGLIGRILAARPSLQSAAERPVVYGLDPEAPR